MTLSGSVIPFVKANACGNDFLIVEGIDPHANLSGLSRTLCERHRGVGADGVEWLFPDPQADVHARLFNADGSEAEISGNGTRCVAAYLCARESKERIVIRTGAGLKVCTLKSRNGTEYDFETAMGEPQVGAGLSISLPPGRVDSIPVSMGNPHCVIFVSEFSVDWKNQAAEIGRLPQFKHGINLEFVMVRDRGNIDVRFFERGVGETQSSGTGSCAAAVAAISSGRADSPLRVHAPGGRQTVRWEEEVFLLGPAKLICRGEFFS
jgi:diaminopimelate epimerase